MHPCACAAHKKPALLLRHVLTRGQLLSRQLNLRDQCILIGAHRLTTQSEQLLQRRQLLLRLF